jgi:hypothetical protein
MKIKRRVPILPILVTAWSSTSCADIAAPTRSDVYEWRGIVATGPSTADTLSFHWPRSRLPVKVWTEDTLDLPTHVHRGIEQWTAAFLYREFEAIQVSDSTAADVIVRAGSLAKSTASVIRRERSMAPECTGITNIELLPGGREIQVPIRVFVNARFDVSMPGVPECLALTVTHELGHAIGILEHSPVPTDIMYSDPVVPALSPRDQATVERAYHTEPTLTVGSR